MNANRTTDRARLLTVAMIALSIATSAAAQTGNSANELPRAVLILDQSGSMWGRLGQSQKVHVARRAIRRILPELRGRLRLGVVAYGHRRRRSCTDIETLHPISRVNPDAVSKAIESVEPNGRTPISEALRHAAEQLDYENRAGTIILLSDGFENCRQDPCVVTRELRRKAKNLTISVVGLSLNNKDVQRLRCVPRLGGGELLTATSLEELEDALSQIFSTVSYGGSIAGAGAGSAKKTVSPVPKGPPGLQLSAVLANGGRRLTGEFEWTVKKTGGNGDTVYQGKEAAPRLDLAPGKYRVEARLGLASAHREVTVRQQGTTQLTMPLNAGRIRILTYANRGGEALENVFYSVSRKRSGSARKPEIIAVSREAIPSYVLPAGSYEIQVQHGLTRRERTVSIRAGDQRRVEIELDVGVLQLSAVATGTRAKLGEMLFLVFEDDPDASRGLREVARSAASSPEFTLPAGLYHVVARHGRAKSRLRVTVRPGEPAIHTIEIPAARILAMARIANSDEQLKDQLTFYVLAEGGELNTANALARTSQPVPVIRLAAGRYRLLGRLGPANARAQAKIVLRPGESKRAVLEYEAGWVSFRLAKSAGGAALGDVYWRIRDDSGREVWNTGLASPTIPLATGAYEVVAEHRSRRTAARFTLRTGERNQIELLTQ